MVEVETKVCTRCKEPKELSNFSKQKDSIRCYCKKCENSYQEKWREKWREEIRRKDKIRYKENKEKKKKLNKKWIEANQEELKEYRKKYYEEHKEKIKEQAKQYYQANKKHVKEKQKQWREKNKEHLKDKTMKKNNKERVKKFGEVFTPQFLVDDMLNTLPAEVWANPNLKWLDPCVGHGQFAITIIERLMVGLEGWEPNTMKRFQHIAENMIYAVEIQEDNAEIYLGKLEELRKKYEI